jgi:hypothetical protein
MPETIVFPAGVVWRAVPMISRTTLWCVGPASGLTPGRSSLGKRPADKRRPYIQLLGNSACVVATSASEWIWNRPPARPFDKLMAPSKVEGLALAATSEPRFLPVRSKTRFAVGAA